jgi:hypothetical protein
MGVQFPTVTGARLPPTMLSRGMRTVFADSLKNGRRSLSGFAEGLEAHRGPSAPFLPRPRASGRARRRSPTHGRRANIVVEHHECEAPNMFLHEFRDDFVLALELGSQRSDDAELLGAGRRVPKSKNKREKILRQTATSSVTSSTRPFTARSSNRRSSTALRRWNASRSLSSPQYFGRPPRAHGGPRARRQAPDRRGADGPFDAQYGRPYYCVQGPARVRRAAERVA